MKVGIVTFWEAFDNYGQALQCWALQQELKRLGHEPFVVRYKLSGRPDKGIKAKLNTAAHCLYAILKQIIKGDYSEVRRQQRNVKTRDFASFRDKNYSLSPHIYYSLDELCSMPPEADAYIVGSDQVWGYKIREKESDVFFLGFGAKETLRIAYAPSFGLQKYPEELEEDLKRKLSHFNSLSVREKAGVHICGKVGYRAEHVLDPTLLLNKEVYESLRIKHGNTARQLFVYSINIKSAKDIRWDEIKEYARDNQLELTATTSSGYVPARELLDGASYEYSKVGEWLDNISRASLVVTTSFHGVAFSIIMHTPFVYVPLTGGHSSGNNRVTELLESLNLTSRIMKDDKPFKDFVSETIDWVSVDNLLNTRREQSLKYLQESLKMK